MSEILVLGAGMVGVSTALALQGHGHDVTLMDRREPGKETSFGNAGFIQVEAAEPYAMPQDAATLLRYATGQSNDVTWAPMALLQQAGPLWSYFRHSGRAQHRGWIAQTYAQLTARATRDHAPLIRASNSTDLISEDGYNVFYRSPRDFEKAIRELERISATYGRRGRAMDARTCRREEPALRADPAGAIHWDDVWTCADPGGLTAAYARLFRTRGGQLLTGDASSLEQLDSGWRVTTPQGSVTAEMVVVALGPWSPAFLKRFGYHIPMILKRGYHGHYEAAATLRRPAMDADYGIVLAPMTRGLRLTTGAAIVPMSAPADPRQLERGLQGARQLFDIGARKPETQWFGTRPCLPEMLPLTGPAPHHKGMWFNFGHGHQGFTLGPTTGDLLARAVVGENCPLIRALAPSGRGY